MCTCVCLFGGLTCSRGSGPFTYSACAVCHWKRQERRCMFRVCLTTPGPGMRCGPPALHCAGSAGPASPGAPPPVDLREELHKWGGRVAIGPHGCSSTRIVTKRSPNPIPGATEGFRKKSNFREFSGATKSGWGTSPWISDPPAPPNCHEAKGAGPRGASACKHSQGIKATQTWNTTYTPTTQTQYHVSSVPRRYSPEPKAHSSDPSQGDRDLELFGTQARPLAG